MSGEIFYDEELNKKIFHGTYEDEGEFGDYYAWYKCSTRFEVDGDDRINEEVMLEDITIHDKEDNPLDGDEYEKAYSAICDDVEADCLGKSDKWF